MIDGEVPVIGPQTHVTTGMRMDSGIAPRRNIAQQSAQEKHDAQNRRNFERHQKRKVAAARRVPAAVTARVDNLQLFIGTNNTNRPEHSIAWEHRARLGKTRID